MIFSIACYCFNRYEEKLERIWEHVEYITQEVIDNYCEDYDEFFQDFMRRSIKIQNELEIGLFDKSSVIELTKLRNKYFELITLEPKRRPY